MDSLVTGRDRTGSSTGLESGDRAPPFALLDQSGESVTPLDDEIAGKPVLLVFRTGDAGAAYPEELAAFRERHDEFAALEATVLAITRDSVEANSRLHVAQDLPFKVLSDGPGAVFKAYGLASGGASDGGSGAAITMVLDPNLHVIEVLNPGPRGGHAAAALRGLSRAAGERPPGRLGAHPPVLVVPRALGKEDCASLIEAWHRPVAVWDTDGLACAGYEMEKGDFKVRNESYGRVEQLVVRDPKILANLDAKLWRRVLPEIRKAFQTKVAQREDYRVARYDAAEGGWLPPHRDNVVPETRHRRFTLSVMLNAGGFEGGGLRFREYGEQEYLVETGTVIVWSCALLHEVLPITAGQRFILGTHLFGG